MTGPLRALAFALSLTLPVSSAIAQDSVRSDARLSELEVRNAIEKGVELQRISFRDEPGFRGRSTAVLCGQVLIAEGDSWFNLPLKLDIVEALRRLEWKVYSSARHGDTLESMAYDNEQLRNLAETFEETRLFDQRIGGRDDVECQHGPYSSLFPKAILVSGGGNDIVGRHFSFLLEHGGSSADLGAEADPEDTGGVYYGLNRDVVSPLLKRLERTLLEYVSSISSTCTAVYNESDGGDGICQGIPIYLHGYDYAQASGRGYRVIVTWAGPWLLPAFDLKQLSDDTVPDVHEKVIEWLIDEYNEVLCSVATDATESEQVANPVYHLDFRGEVGSDWRDELHPDRNAVQRLAGVVSDSVVAYHRFGHPEPCIGASD